MDTMVPPEKEGIITADHHGEPPVQLLVLLNTRKRNRITEDKGMFITIIVSLI